MNTVVAHLQANGLVERANKSLMEGIKTRSKAVILAEIGMPTYRTKIIRESLNEEEIRLNLDLLTERRELAAIREAKYKTKLEQYYNKKVHLTSFKPGEFVFWKNEASRVEDQGKLGPKWEGLYRVAKAYQNGFYKLQTMKDKEVPRTWHAINLQKCYL
ncbi:reverse transcriptase domain-containing protein [Tanacetum coccineum]